MKKVLFALALFLIGSLLWVATPAVQAASTSMSGTSWVLSSLNEQLPLPGTEITLQFADEDAGGSDGCNRYTAPYTTKGSSISFGASTAASTMMACSGPVSDQADLYLQALADANKYHVQGNHLVLLDGRTVVATFVAVTQNLANSTWQVKGYNNGNGAVVSVLPGTDITAAFDAQGEVAGNSGCNDYFGSYLTANGAILISSVGATRRDCPMPPGIMEQENQYLTALQSAATFTVEGNQLTLRNGAGAIAVTMQRTPVAIVSAPVPGVPSGRVTAPNGVNVRSGPGTNYPILGTAPFGAEGEIVGRSADGAWWAASMPSAPGGVGWVSGDFVAVTNVQDVPVLDAPPIYVPPPPPSVPTPAPWPTAIPQPTPTPAPEISFWADSTTINQGQCTTLNWSVENVQAVWVYPQGQPYQQYPRTGQGREEVCPPQTTTYEMRVLLRNGSTVTQQVTINVVPAAPQNPLSSTAWQVTAYNTGGVMASPLSGTAITARFTAEQITGNTGCNDYQGPYYVSGFNIAIGNLATGMLSCDDTTGLMQQERDYLAALQSAATFQFNGNRLEFYGADGVTLVMFTRLQ